MGRKGMKGFMKSAARPSDKPDEEESQQQEQQAAKAAPSATAAANASSTAAAPAKPAAAAAVAVAAAAGGGSDDDGGSGENRSKMLQRHKKEMLAHKKAVQRLGKKSKDELAKLDAEITARHAKELQELDTAAAAAAAAAVGAGPAVAKQAVAAADGSAAVADSASKYLKDVSNGEEEAEEAGGKGKKLSKAQKRREKMAAQDAEREARIAAELAELGPSERATEEASLAELLIPMGLAIKEIRADGHCLYRSLQDQLDQTAAAAAAAAAGGSNGSSEQQQQYNYQELRELAADYIREHKDQFAPFLLPEDEGQDPEEYYEQYCYTLETTAAWGGHLELSALSSALKRQIHVHAVGMDTIKLGEDEYAEQPALEVCYLRHAFGLGEHYNSTKKLLLGALVDDEDEGDEEPAEAAKAAAESL